MSGAQRRQAGTTAERRPGTAGDGEDLAAVRSVERLVQPARGRFALGVACGAASAACAIGLMWTSGYLIAASSLQPPILFLMPIIVSVRFFALGRATFRYIERLASHDAAFRMLGSVRTAIFDALAPRAPAGLTRLRRGDLMTRFMADVDQLQDIPLRVRHPLWSTGTVAALSVVLIAFISPRTALVLLVFLLLAGVLGAALPAWLAARDTARLAPHRARINDDVLDLADRIEVLSAFDAQEPARRRVHDDDDTLRCTVAGLQYQSGATTAAMVLLAGVAALACGWAGVVDLGRGAFDGPFLAVLVLVPLSVFDVLGDAAQAAQARALARASARRVAAVTGDLSAAAGAAAESAHSAADGTAVPAQSADGSEGEPAAPRPPFTGLSLRAADLGWPGRPPVVRGLDLDIAPGQRILVTGTSGAGKSTLAATLVRFLDLAAGTYTLNGQDAERLPPDAVRAVVGLCEQTPHVFDATVRGNLQLAAPDASDAQLEEVLARVGLWDDLRRREGLETAVGSDGELLSGGQVQRLSLARAILGGFGLIVLDEPTANVDPELAAELLDDLLRVAADGRRAVLLISHSAVTGPIDAHLDLDAKSTTV
ncbi:MAG: thiol reductant ABC exporter subunit CydC [Pseudoclavibacter sp.]|jgi:ATP-binding cassette subfamily C protein CydC